MLDPLRGLWLFPVALASETQKCVVQRLQYKPGVAWAPTVDPSNFDHEPEPLNISVAYNSEGNSNLLSNSCNKQQTFFNLANKR
jgi:hypothetical protein